jgi:membrane fusion protein (multidrug efflux system)
VANPLFRQEAVDFHRRGGAKGEVLRLMPGAFLWTHWMLVAVIFAAGFLAFTGQIDEYASGPALVRVDGVHELTASRAAVVERVDVAPGERIKVGQVLLRMQSSAEVADLQSSERELADQLSKLLRDPADRVAREAILSLRARRDLARANLDQLTLRAQEATTVGDVRVHAGQLVEPGMALLTLLRAQSGATLTALFPGRYRPLLSRGMTLRFVADGFPRVVHRLTIERVGDQIVGPSEALRFLGRDQIDTMPLDGPVVIVQARLGTRAFVADGATYQFHHGMQGHAETPVRRESIVFTLIPGLRQIADNLSGLWVRR